MKHFWLGIVTEHLCKVLQRGCPLLKYYLVLGLLQLILDILTLLLVV